MRDLAKFLSFFDRNLLGILGIFVIAAVTVIAMQCGLFWAGGLFSSAVEINSVLVLLSVTPLIVGAGLTNHKGNGNIIVALLAIIGIYICVVWYFHWGVLIGCIALLISSLIRLEKIGGDPVWTNGMACTYLLYSVGAYFAMLFYGFEPAADLGAIIVLLLVSVFLWFRCTIE